MRLPRTTALSLMLGGWLAAGALPIGAQSLVMTLPRVSQGAMAGQRIALTDITIKYHRPLVGGRKVWGGQVPYDQVWRGGANENTTIEFSDPVLVEGKALDKGIYGLHMIPGMESWTVIFSKNSTSWGSFTYNQSEDALRVTVKPQPAEFHEALAYDFDDVKPDSTLVTLRWEKLAVPFRVTVASPEITLQNIRNQLRNTAQYTWIGWDDAANFCVDAKVSLDQGLKWVEQSIQIEERFENLQTKAKVLDALNRSNEAASARDRSLTLASAPQLYTYGRQLQMQKKKGDAIAVYRTVAKRFPDHWLGHIALARAHVADGDFEGAVKEVRAAETAGAPDQQKANLELLIHRLESKEDINS